MSNVQNRVPVIQFVGYSNSGKTSLVVAIIEALQGMGIKVGVIKHDGHDFEMDHEGKDTWKFRQAGASLVAIQSATKTAYLEQGSVALDKLIARMEEGGAELIIIEGYKREGYPKIAVIREAKDVYLLDQITNVLGVASWIELTNLSIPVCHVDDQEKVLQMMLVHREKFYENKRK